MKTKTFENGKEKLKAIKVKLLKSGFTYLSDYRTRIDKAFYFQKEKKMVFIVYNFVNNKLNVFCYNIA